MTAFARAEQVLAEHRRRLLRRKGVTGVGVGYRIKDGEPTDEVCIQVFVAEKLPESMLNDHVRLADEIEGVPVDVIEGTFDATACRSQARSRRKRRERLVGGIKIRRIGRTSFGTLGLILEGDGVNYALSAEHVVARGARVGQPRTSSQFIGRVIAASRSSNANVDASLIELDPGRRPVAGGVLGGDDGLVVSGDRVRLGDRVVVSGCCSGTVRGRVISKKLSPRVEYADGTSVQFRDQIAVRMRSPGLRAGDSGSIVLDRDGKDVLGLLIAKRGSGAGTIGVVTPILRILDMGKFQPGGSRLKPVG